MEFPLEIRIAVGFSESPQPRVTQMSLIGGSAQSYFSGNATLWSDRRVEKQNILYQETRLLDLSCELLLCNGWAREPFLGIPFIFHIRLNDW